MLDNLNMQGFIIGAVAEKVIVPFTGAGDLALFYVELPPTVGSEEREAAIAKVAAKGFKPIFFGIAPKAPGGTGFFVHPVIPPPPPTFTVDMATYYKPETATK